VAATEGAMGEAKRRRERGEMPAGPKGAWKQTHREKELRVKAAAAKRGRVFFVGGTYRRPDARG
jgi:hypothetical protein